MAEENVTYLTEETSRQWATRQYWGIFEAAMLLHAVDPRNLGIVGNRTYQGSIGDKVISLYESLRRGIRLKTLPFEEFCEEYDPETEMADYSVVLKPKEFLGWAKEQNIEIPALLWDVVMTSRTSKGVSVELDTKLPEDSSNMRLNQRHKERCRAIAEMLWEKHPEITIADMSLKNEIVKYGCEGKVYAEDTMRNWLKDLCPDRSPGRRPGVSS